MIRKLLVVLAAASACAVALALFQQTFLYSPERDYKGPIADDVLADVPGWRVEERALANAPEAQARVEGILNFTEAISREYHRTGKDFTVYAAYWAPKTMPVRMVQAHTPEICFVRNGWVLDKAKTQRAVPLEFGGVTLRPAEYRELYAESNPAIRTHVYYWHIVGDSVYVTDTVAGTWNRWDPILSLFRYGLNQKTEQFFVRVNSSKPFDEIMDDPGFEMVMQQLTEMALGQPTTEESASDA